MPARIYGTLTCLEPGLGALAGFLFPHESPTRRNWPASPRFLSRPPGTALTSKAAGAVAGHVIGVGLLSWAGPHWNWGEVRWLFRAL